MKAKLALYDIAVVGISAAILIAVQVALAALPNIELVSLLIILFALHYGYKTLYIIYVFALMEGLIWGFHIWWLTYLYVWTILFFAARAMRPFRHSLVMIALMSAVFGLLFGALTSIPYFFSRGVGGGIAYIIVGIPFDLLHCTGNFVVALVLFAPLDRLFGRVMKAHHPGAAPTLQQ